MNPESTTAELDLAMTQPIDISEMLAN